MVTLSFSRAAQIRHAAYDLREYWERPELAPLAGSVHVDPDVFTYLAFVTVVLRERESLGLLHLADQTVPESYKVLELEALRASKRDGHAVTTALLRAALVQSFEGTIANPTELESILHIINNDLEDFRRENLLMTVLSSLCRPFRDSCQKGFEQYVASVHAQLSGLPYIMHNHLRQPIDERFVREIERELEQVCGYIGVKSRWYGDVLCAVQCAGAKRGIKNPVPYTILPDLQKSLERFMLQRLGPSVFPLFNGDHCHDAALLTEAGSWLVNQGFNPWSAGELLKECRQDNWKFFR